MTHETAPIGGPLGLCRQIRTSLDALLSSSQALTRSLVHRQVEQTWDLLELQEKQTGDLNRQLELWQSLFTGQAPSSFPAEVQQLRAGIQADLGRLQAVSRENAALSRSFSGVIREALNGLSGAKPGRSHLYNRYGRRHGGRQPLLVNSVG